jgi:nucleoside-diphosphate-sugar epimerase
VTCAVDKTVVVTGTSGRIGQMLRAAWAQNPPPGIRLLWSGRGFGADVPWDIAAGIASLPKGCVVLHLAAVLRGDAAQMAQNTCMAQNVTASALASGASAVLMASTAAVYGARDGDCREDDMPQPVSPYGRAKLAAEQALVQGAGGVPVSCLRIGNVVGADALLGAAGRVVTLDPVAGQAGGPVRSWIGPQRLAQVLAGLVLLPDVPPLLNVACNPPLPMADLLDAAGVDWHYGPANPAVLPRAVLNTRRLDALMPLPATTPAALVADWRGLLETRA